MDIECVIIVHSRTYNDLLCFVNGIIGSEKIKKTIILAFSKCYQFHLGSICSLLYEFLEFRK